MSCEEHEIAIERRLAGDLDPVGERALEAHLATCADCRGWAERARGLERALRAPRRELDWRRLERRVLALERKERRAPLRAALLALALVVVAVGRQSPWLAWLAAGVALEVPWSWLRRRARAVASAAEGDRRGQLLSTWRTELERRRSGLVVGALLALFLGLWWVAAVVPGLAERIGATPRPGLGLAMAAVFGALAYWWGIVRRGRLARELAELGA